MSRYYYMKLLVISIFVFLIFIASIFYYTTSLQLNLLEGFQGSPPSNYVDLLPSSDSDIQKLIPKNNTFPVKLVKRYFPNLIKEQTVQKRGMLPVKIKVVDPVGIVAVAWKVADELNQNNIIQRNLLKDLDKTLIKSKEAFELIKGKCE